MKIAYGCLLASEAGAEGSDCTLAGAEGPDCILNKNKCLKKSKIAVKCMAVEGMDKSYSLPGSSGKIKADSSQAPKGT